MGHEMKFCRKFLVLALAIPSLGQTPEGSSIQHSGISTEKSGPTHDSRILVDGVKYPLTQIGVQQAFTDACALNGGVRGGSEVILPPGLVNLTNTTGQQFLITCPLKIT